MAAKTPKMLNNPDVFVKNERGLMNKLRDSGQEYISSSGKLIAAKKQPDTFCHCPQKCKRKLPSDTWQSLFQQFYDLAEQNIQNHFLQTHIIIKTVHLHNWESEKPSPANKRRVTCRYHVPCLRNDTRIQHYIKKRGDDSVEVCQKAFMNCYGITEKRVRMQRERCISRLAPDHYKNSPFPKKQKPSNQRNQSKAIEEEEEGEEEALDLTQEKKEDGREEQPLDLSSPKRSKSPIIIDVDRSKLYEIAEMIGVSRDRIDREMAEKYEQLVRQSLKKKQRALKKKTWEIENRSPRSPTDNSFGLEEDAMLSVQTLNNGDLTITPVTPVTPVPSPVEKVVENGDLMRVNYFFQNQLWKPEYIGLSSWKRLLGHAYEV